jgi:predicted dehydrogenase
MESRPLKVAVIGYGSIGKRHVNIVREQTKHVDIWIYSGTQKLESLTSVSGIFNSIDQLLEYHPDIAIVANPSSLHLDIALTLAKNKIDMLIEKPVSNAEDGVLELINYIEENKLVVRVGYNLRYQPSLIYFKNLIQSSYIHNICYVRSEVGQHLSGWRPNTNISTGVTANKFLGGGVLRELSHEIDYIQWIFGDIVCVSGNIRKLTELTNDVEDFADLSFMIKTHESNKETVVMTTLDCIRKDRIRKCTVITENVTLLWDGVEDVVSEWNPETETWQVIFSGNNDRDESYKLQWQGFMTAFERREEDFGLSVRTALKTVAVIQAAEKSNENNCQMTILDAGKYLL